MLGDAIMFFVMASILYIIVQKYHYKYRYGVVYDMVKEEEFRSRIFFIKGILHLLKNVKISKNTMLTICSLFASMLFVQYSTVLWTCLLIFIICILWRVHKEREYVLLSSGSFI